MTDDDLESFKRRLARYYPGVLNPEVNLPTSWNSRDKNNCIGLSTRNLRVLFKGTEAKRNKEAASVRANKSIPTSCGAYYFEIRIVSKGKEGHIGIGISTEHAQLSKLPGWERDCFGYHADDGNFFCGSGSGQAYGPTYTTGDVVGCCINFGVRELFFTKNGVPFGAATRALPNLPYYPIVGMRTAGEIIEANFGQDPFVYDFENYLKELHSIALSDVVSTPITVPNCSYPMSHYVRNLVLSYLCSAGYAASATAFSRTSGAQLPEQISIVKSRQQLRKFIVDGLIAESIEFLEQMCPGLLSSKPYLLFTLKCQQFIEIIRSMYVDHPNGGGAMSISPSSTSAGPVIAPAAGGGDSQMITAEAPIAAVAEPSTSSATVAQMEDGGNTSVVVAAVELASLVSGEAMNSNGSCNNGNSKNGHAHNGLTLDSLVNLGREVYALGDELAKQQEQHLMQQQQQQIAAATAISGSGNTRSGSALANPRDLALPIAGGGVHVVSGPTIGVGPVAALGGGANVRKEISVPPPPISPFRIKIREVLSLIANPDPASSSLLSPEHREFAWCTVSRAVLEAQLPNSIAGLSPLEQLTAHSRQLANTLGRFQMPAVSLLPLDAFFYPARSGNTKVANGCSSNGKGKARSFPHQPSSSSDCFVSEPC